MIVGPEIITRAVGQVRACSNRKSGGKWESGGVERERKGEREGRGEGEVGRVWRKERVVLLR